MKYFFLTILATMMLTLGTLAQKTPTAQGEPAAPAPPAYAMTEVEQLKVQVAQLQEIIQQLQAQRIQLQEALVQVQSTQATDNLQKTLELVKASHRWGSEVKYDRSTMSFITDSTTPPATQPAPNPPPPAKQPAAKVGRGEVAPKPNNK